MNIFYGPRDQVMMELMNDLRKDIMHQLERLKKRSQERQAEHDRDEREWQLLHPVLPYNKPKPRR
jgi:hypothetical protein